LSAEINQYAKNYDSGIVIYRVNPALSIVAKLLVGEKGMIKEEYVFLREAL